jgi:hypothetical protein
MRQSKSDSPRIRRTRLTVADYKDWGKAQGAKEHKNLWRMGTPFKSNKSIGPQSCAHMKLNSTERNEVLTTGLLPCGSQARETVDSHSAMSQINLCCFKPLSLW